MKAKGVYIAIMFLVSGTLSAQNDTMHVYRKDGSLVSYATTDIRKITFEGVVRDYTLNLKVYMEGPFAGDQMLPYLNFFGFLPVNQPYNIAPWYYGGTEAVTAIPNADVVDWVLVELRRTTGGPETAITDSIICREACFLMKDGKIRDTDGISDPVVSLAIKGNIFAVIRHRNHLDVMSGSPLMVTGHTLSYDFTTGGAYNGSLAQKELAPGTWGMISSDGNGDGYINNTDKIEVWNPQSGSSGYKSGDFNLDGYVNNTDKIDYWAPNTGRSCQVP